MERGERDIYTYTNTIRSVTTKALCGDVAKTRSGSSFPRPPRKSCQTRHGISLDRPRHLYPSTAARAPRQPRHRASTPRHQGAPPSAMRRPKRLGAKAQNACACAARGGDEVGLFFFRKTERCKSNPQPTCNDQRENRCCGGSPEISLARLTTVNRQKEFSVVLFKLRALSSKRLYSHIL